MQQNIYTLNEDGEPPSTCSQSFDFKGYRSSQITTGHDPVCGRNHSFKTNPFKEKQEKRNYSLSSCSVPTVLRTAEYNGRFGEHPGLMDEDDEYPPSGLYGIESQIRGILEYCRITKRGCSHLTSNAEKIHSIYEKRRTLSLTNEQKIARAVSLRSALEIRASAYFHRSLSYVSRFRSVPSGRLAPPGTIVR
jgi:hypothetical protein